MSNIITDAVSVVLASRKSVKYRLGYSSIYIYDRCMWVTNVVFHRITC